MRKVIVTEFMSLDGVVQAPGGETRTQAAGSSTAAGTSSTSTTSPRRACWRTSSRPAASCSGAAPTRSSPRIGNASEEEQVIAEPLNAKRPESRS
jgi:hypothetical protein